MATNEPVWYSVRSGPEVKELLESFENAFARKKVYVTFRVKNTRDISYSSGSGFDIDAVITGLRYESGAPGHLILEMNVDGYIKSGGYYNAIDNTGHFHMTPRR